MSKPSDRQRTRKPEKTTMLVVRVSPALKRAIERHASAQGTTVSEVVRRALLLRFDEEE